MYMYVLCFNWCGCSCITFSVELLCKSICESLLIKEIEQFTILLYSKSYIPNINKIIYIKKYSKNVHI